MEGMTEEGRLGWILKTSRVYQKKKDMGKEFTPSLPSLEDSREPHQNRVILGTGMNQTQTGLSRGFTLCWKREVGKNGQNMGEGDG